MATINIRIAANVLLGLLVSAGLLSAAQPAKDRVDSGYAGSKVCAGCHSQIYSNYVKTAMGRSLVPARDTLNLAPPPHSPASIQSGNITYEVSRQREELYQTEYQLDASGKPIFKKSYRLEYAIGSGVNGTTYAIRRDGYLVQAPLSHYRRANTWQLSPGYERENLGFSRPIASACIVCHSGRPRPVLDQDGLYADPPFAELSIGCENCHGPGAEHVKRPGRTTIVNPARLPARVAEDICMNCHQAGDTRAFQPGRTYSDFRPGTPLSETVAIFKIPLKPADGPQRDLLEHHFSMTLSKCYRATNGRLSCLTCHDPHTMPAKESKAGYYEQKCLSCHTVSSCKLPLEQRVKEPDGCIGCHMPKADIGFISHSALTNHRIVLQRGAPLPAIAYTQTTPDLPDLIYLNRNDRKPVAPMVLLQAYGELMDRAPQYASRYLQLLDALAATPAKDPLLEAALGRRALREGGANATNSAVDHLSSALKLGFTGATAFEDLANALSTQGKTAEAIDVLKRGIELSPYAPRLHKLLAVQYINSAQYELARSTMQHYLDIFPEDAFMRDLLRKAGG